MKQGNIEVFNDFYAPDYVYYFPSNSQESMSLEETQELVEGVLSAFPDFNWNIEELFAVEDRIIVRLSTRGANTGEFQGIPATGNKIESSAIFIVRIENGKVVEEREEFDMLGAIQQLGMELKPKEEEKLILRVAALTKFSWNHNMPEIIKEIKAINKFKDLAPETKV